jgi:hypothetical protein
MADFELTPSTIFLQSTESIDRYLELAHKPKGFKDAELATQFRAELFHLEGWARLHRHWPEESERKSFEKIRKVTKTLEDILGRVDLLLALSEEAKKKKSSALETLFEKDLKAARRSLKHVLKHDDWFGDGKTRTSKFRKRLAKIEWPTPENHYRSLAAEIVQSIGNLQRRFDQEIRPALSKPLTHEILEHDVHEFRREIRWFAIYFQTGQGLFALAPLPKKLSPEEKKLVQAYKDSPFVKLPSAVYTKGWLNPVAYIELTRLIQIIGEIKDQAEKFFFMKEGLMRTGATEAEAQRQVLSWYGDVPLKTVEKMQKVAAEFESRLPLKRISQDLAEGL